MRNKSRSLLASLVGAALLAATPMAIAPASATSASFVDDTVAEFEDGTTQDVAVGEDGLTLGPGSSDFDGNALPAGWTFVPTTAGSGSATVANGQLTVDGGTVLSNQRLRPGQTIIARVTFANFSSASQQEIAFFNPDNLAQASYGGANPAYTQLRNQISIVKVDRGANWVRISKLVNGAWQVLTNSGVGAPTTQLVLGARDLTAGGATFSIDYVNEELWGNGQHDFDGATNWSRVGGGTGSNSYANGVLTTTGGIIGARVLLAQIPCWMRGLL